MAHVPKKDALLAFLRRLGKVQHRASCWLLRWSAIIKCRLLLYGTRVTVRVLGFPETTWVSQTSCKLALAFRSRLPSASDEELTDEG
jgi:hypothetical protein